mmetsp:Transcript_43842/g.135362  ORF Transcript_43842/g.135362 Transcript_43842/m.135362 type:complete len:228 (-) Transcript_43842:473-1156(-)
MQYGSPLQPAAAEYLRAHLVWHVLYSLFHSQVSFRAWHSICDGVVEHGSTQIWFRPSHWHVPSASHVNLFVLPLVRHVGMHWPPETLNDEALQSVSALHVSGVVCQLQWFSQRDVWPFQMHWRLGSKSHVRGVEWRIGQLGTQTVPVATSGEQSGAARHRIMSVIDEHLASHTLATGFHMQSSKDVHASGAEVRNWQRVSQKPLAVSIWHMDRAVQKDCVKESERST